MAATKDCQWLNRYYYESLCSLYKYEPKEVRDDAKLDAHNFARQGVCAGEMVCKEKWSYEKVEFNKGKLEKKTVELDAGVYPINCVAKNPGPSADDQTCEGVTVEKCVEDHLKNLAGAISDKSTEGNETVLQRNYLNQNLTGPKAPRKKDAEKGNKPSDIPAHK